MTNEELESNVSLLSMNIGLNNIAYKHASKKDLGGVKKRLFVLLVSLEVFMRNNTLTDEDIVKVIENTELKDYYTTISSVEPNYISLIRENGAQQTAISITNKANDFKSFIKLF